MLARAVLDPGVLVAALLSREGAPARLVTAWFDGSFEIVTSPALLAELARVLERPKFRPYVSADEARRYVRLFARGGLLFDDPPTAPWVPADPGDDYLVCLAKAARTNALVSGDAHLLALVDLEPPVMTPRAFLERVER
ncbi:MAG: putative toxin-antitoxin system toxin component, PIN family [Coriobacteriia bacterium]